MLLNSVYLITVILAGGITTAMALHLWTNRRIIEPDLSILLVVFLWLWITAQIGECVAGPVAQKVVFYKIKFTGISLVSVTLLGFGLQYLHGQKPYLRPFLSAIAVPLLVFNLLSFFHAVEPFFWKKFLLSPNRLLLDIEPAAGYVAFNLYTIFLIAGGYILFVISAFSVKTIKKRQSIPFLFAALLSTAAGLTDFFLKREIFYYRLLPIALAVSSLAVIYYLRLQYFRTIPLAQHAVSQSMSDGLIILSPQNDIVYVNPAAHGLFKAPANAIIGRPLADFVGGLAAFVESAPDGAVRNRTAVLDDRWFDVGLSPIKSRRGRVVSKVFVLRDITHLKEVEDSLRELTNELERKVKKRTKQLEDSNRALQAEVEERKRAEERIQASLEEKSVLLGELHHRVKNNLQIVSSLLRLQSHYLSDPLALELFDISISRIRSMAMVHEKLCKSDDLAHTQFGQYLHELVQSVIFSHSKTSDQFDLKLAVESIDLDIDKSILAGLIVNELVMNSLKHAFPAHRPVRDGAKNEIAVEFRVEEGEYALVYADNGPGLPPGFTIEKTDSLGMKIVATLVKQLKGTIALLPHEGMKAIIRFPVRKSQS